MRNLFLWPIIIFLGFMGCSLDYQAGGPSDELLESVPDVSFDNFVHTSVNGDKMLFQLEAAKAQLFNKRQLTLLSQVRFIQYDDAGAVAIEGRAGEAVFHNDTENAELSSGVYCYSVTDKVRFRAQNLSWNRDDRLMRSKGGEIVRIEKDDGSFIQGARFTLDIRRKSVIFEAAVQGRYIRENTETNTENN